MILCALHHVVVLDTQCNDTWRAWLACGPVTTAAELVACAVLGAAWSTADYYSHLAGQCIVLVVSMLSTTSGCAQPAAGRWLQSSVRVGPCTRPTE